MPPVKKSVPSKFLTAELDDFLTDSEFLNGSPKKNKPTKRQKAVTVKAEVPNLSDTIETGAKKKKRNESIEACGDLRKKALTVTNRQLDARKQFIEKMLKNLFDGIEDFEVDYNALKENEQKLQHLFGSLMKCMQQSTTAYKQELKSFKELYASYKKRYEDIDLQQRGEMEKLVEELEEDISKLKQKLIKETKQGEWENYQKYFMKAMQNKF